MRQPLASEIRQVMNLSYRAACWEILAAVNITLRHH